MTLILLFRDRVNVSEVESASLLSPLEKIEIGHDNSGAAAGWYLERVEVTCHSTGIQQVSIAYKKWLCIVMQEASDALGKTADSDTVSTYQVSSVQLVTDKKLEASTKWI